jgi:hypothetical protein
MEMILKAMAPHLLELSAAIVTVIIGWLAAKAKTKWGIEIEARHREALHSALMTGVRHALSQGLKDRAAVALAAVEYVEASVPDALSALRPSPHRLIDMAEATLEGVARARS